MPESQCFNLRKRQRAEHHSPQLNETSQSQPKKQKLDHPTPVSHSPAVFWDSLSKIWLTKRALRELRRRDSQRVLNTPRSQHRRSRRPVTRKSLAELKGKQRAPISAADFLSHCGPTVLKDIRLFARRGGPDLSDLKGVCIARRLLADVKADEL